MHDPAERAQYLSKRYLQFVHKAICMKLTPICGQHIGSISVPPNWDVVFARLNMFKGSERPVSYDQKIDKREIDDGIAIGRTFSPTCPPNPNVSYSPRFLTQAQNLASQMLLQADLAKRWCFRNNLMVFKHLMAVIWILQVRNAGPKPSLKPPGLRFKNVSRCTLHRSNSPENFYGTATAQCGVRHAPDDELAANSTGFSRGSASGSGVSKSNGLSRKGCLSRPVPTWLS